MKYYIFKDRYYKPVPPRADGEDIEDIDRIILYHNSNPKIQTTLAWVKANTGLHAGWIVGVENESRKSNQ